MAVALGVVASLGFGASGVRSATAAELSGSVSLVSGRSGRPARGVEVAETVVSFAPAERVPPNVPNQPFLMATSRKAFSPELLTIPVGAEVVFPNFDPILHNVFSVTPGSRFDLGLYGKGEGKAATFDSPGLVRVFCNVHQAMFGHILVLDSPFYARVDAVGRFTLEGLPAGGGELVVWHPQAELTRIPVSAPGRGLDVKLEVQRRRVPAHLNKFGKPYRSRRDRYNR